MREADVDRPFYRYVWRNNAKRATMAGRLCLLRARGKRNSAMIEFIDNGQIECVSLNSIRKAKIDVKMLGQETY